MRIERWARVALAAILVSGVVGLFVLQGIENVRDAGRRVGFALGEGLGVSSVTPGLPAERAGLRPGDRILEVGGRRLASSIDYDEAAADLRPGRAVLFRVLRGGTVLELQVVPGVRPLWAPFLFKGLTAACLLAVALLALGQGSGDRRARLLLGFTAAMALELALPVSTGHPGLRAVAVSAYYLLTGLQIGLELHLASSIPERHAWLRGRAWVVPAYYVTGIGLGTLAGATYLTEAVRGLRVFPWSLEGFETLLIDVGLPVWGLAVCALLGAQALRHSEPQGRHQAGLVLAGALPWLLFLLLLASLGRLGLAAPDWLYALEGLLLLSYPVALFAAIFRYHLFDIELAARRGLIYTALTGSLLLVFYAALGAGGVLFSHLVEDEASVWSVSAATLLLGLLFAPLRRALQRLIGRRFFPERYALRQRLVALAGELPALGKLPRMGEHLVSRLTGIFSARSAALLIADPGSGLLTVLAAAGPAPDEGRLPRPGDLAALQKSGRPLPGRGFPGLDPDGLVAPLAHWSQGGELTGLLVLGRKEGSRAYPAEELDLLSLLAHHVATVFENARLFESATYEGLTGLLRREAVLEQLDKELERALRYGRPLTVAMADLDHFKSVNDRYGHLAGDRLLQAAARGIAGALRGTDWIGRYGGEEFLLVLPETGIAAACAVAEKIRSLIEESVVPMDGGEGGSSIRATVSIGLASLEDLEGEVTGRGLIAVADQALYEAKRGGRNRVHPGVLVA